MKAQVVKKINIRSKVEKFTDILIFFTTFCVKIWLNYFINK